MPPLVTLYEAFDDHGEDAWMAMFQRGRFVATIEKVQVQHTVLGGVRHHWVLIGNVATWPGLGSDEWIEYVPAPNYAAALNDFIITEHYGDRR